MFTDLREKKERRRERERKRGKDEDRDGDMDVRETSCRRRLGEGLNLQPGYVS